MPKFNRPQKFNKTNIAKVPKDKAIVYKITNNKGENLYTGVAGRGRVQPRLTEHLEKRGEKIPGGSKFKITQVKDKQRALRVEKQIIKRENPKFNDQHNSN